MIEFGVANRTDNIITIPVDGWYAIKFNYQHPSLPIVGSNQQAGLGSDCKVYIKINGSSNVMPFGSEDSAAGTSESSSLVMDRYLSANDTIQFYWDFGASQTNEDFVVSASITNTQYVNTNDPVFSGATQTIGGTSGNVIAPVAGQQYSVLTGDALWTTPDFQTIFGINGTVNKQWSAPIDPATAVLTLSTAVWDTTIINNYFIKLLNGTSQASSISWNAGNFENFRFEVYYKILNNAIPGDILGFYANATAAAPTSETATGGLIYYHDYYDGGSFTFKKYLQDDTTPLISDISTGFNDISDTFVKFTMTRFNNVIEITHGNDLIGNVSTVSTSSTSTSGTYFGIFGRTGLNFMNVEIKSIKLVVL